MKTVGVVDTMFARVDMGTIAEEYLATRDGHGTTFSVIRLTVPGFKDLAVACKRMIEYQGADIVVACGMPGAAAIDEVCAHEASQGIMSAQLMTNTHILEVFVHSAEEPDPDAFRALCIRRVEGHAQNAYWMLFSPEQLRARAGQGIRQGSSDAGPIEGSAA